MFLISHTNQPSAHLFVCLFVCFVCLFCFWLCSSAPLLCPFVGVGGFCVQLLSRSKAADSADEKSLSRSRSVKKRELPKLEDFLKKRDYVGALTLLEVRSSSISLQSHNKHTQNLKAPLWLFGLLLANWLAFFLPLLLPPRLWYVVCVCVGCSF